ncbi:unnamed protein product [Porites evermanni]|uniref:Uncharacterized protein n=1 Tax=Porites evermanni TaxID=104178 RepID=A0ABN8MRB6_9CNID|nr:unnamed protein product [Porites evermanni]
MAEQRRLSSSNSSHSQISESLQTVEESLLVGEKSSPVVLGRQESVFLAESSASTSVEDQENSGNPKAFNQRFVFESCETIQSESVVESEILTEEGDYSDEFESAGSSEGEFSTKDDGVGQGTYIRKKLAVLSSRLGSKTENVRGQVKDKKTVVCDDINNFCSRKIQVLKVKKLMTDGPQSGKLVLRVATSRQEADKSVVGNKRKIASLKIENLMSKTEKVKQQFLHFTSHKTNIYVLMLLKNRGRTKCQIVTLLFSHFVKQIILSYLCLQDSATLIADIVNSCTKTTVPASEVWEKFLCKGDSNNS